MGKTRDLYIFECLIHNLKKVTDEAQAYVPLFIMTSEQNDAETRAFLKEHDYFGYSADNVHFFRQETEPAVDENGKIFMSAPDQIVLSPNGQRAAGSLPCSVPVCWSWSTRSASSG